MRGDRSLKFVLTHYDVLKFREKKLRNEIGTVYIFKGVFVDHLGGIYVGVQVR